MKRSFGNTFPLWSCGGVRTNETLVAVGIFGFGIPPAHPVKAKKEKDNWLEAVKRVQTLELLLKPSNVALLRSIIAQPNFPDSFFYHLSPQNNQRERDDRNQQQE